MLVGCASTRPVPPLLNPCILYADTQELYCDGMSGPLKDNYTCLPDEEYIQLILMKGLR